MFQKGREIIRTKILTHFVYEKFPYTYDVNLIYRKALENCRLQYSVFIQKLVPRQVRPSPVKPLLHVQV